MLVLEGKCPKCYGNLILSEDSYTITCEDCGVTDRAKIPVDLARLLLHCGVPPPDHASLKQLWIILKTRANLWGPIDLRQTLTPAGQIIVTSYEEGEEVRGEEILQAVEASKGLITDKEILRSLKDGGFIL